MGGKQHTANSLSEVPSVTAPQNQFEFKVNEEYQRAVFGLSLEEYEALRESIKQHGMLVPIITSTDGTILDGHHRFEICKELCINPDKPTHTEISFQNLLDEKLFVLSCNLERRNLTPLQKIILSKSILEIEREKAKQRQGMRTDIEPNLAQSEFERATHIAAKKAGLKPSTFKYGLYVLDHAPKEDITKVLNGERTISNLYKEVKRWEAIEAAREKARRLKAPEGKFDVIVIDPPWNYGTDYDPDGRRSASPYPEMTFEELKKLQLPSHENCVLWLWTTNAFIHDAFHLLEAWGFTQKTILTWEKDRMGLGDWLRGKTEHCILAVKGKPVIRLTNQTTILHAKNSGHSCKPSEFYELVDTLCYGRKLDYFAGKKREGWQAYGTFD